MCCVCNRVLTTNRGLVAKIVAMPAPAADTVWIRWLPSPVPVETEQMPSQHQRSRALHGAGTPRPSRATTTGWQTGSWLSPVSGGNHFDPSICQEGKIARGMATPLQCPSPPTPPPPGTQTIQQVPHSNPIAAREFYWIPPLCPAACTFGVTKPRCTARRGRHSGLKRQLKRDKDPAKRRARGHGQDAEGEQRVEGSGQPATRTAGLTAVLYHCALQLLIDGEVNLRKNERFREKFKTANSMCGRGAKEEDGGKTQGPKRTGCAVTNAWQLSLSRTHRPIRQHCQQRRSEAAVEPCQAFCFHDVRDPGCRGKGPISRSSNQGGQNKTSGQAPAVYPFAQHRCTWSSRKEGDARD